MVTPGAFRAYAAVILSLTIVFTAAAKYSGGTGEPNDPYQIATAEDLIALGERPADYDKHFLLTADIDLDPSLPGRKVFDRAVIAPDTDPCDYEKFLGPAFSGTPFSGVFDGNGHTVSRLTITGGGYLGLFGGLGPWDATTCEVRDLGLVDVNITGSGTYVGGLAGRVLSYSAVVTHCYSSGSVRGGSDVGGLVGGNGMCDMGGAVLAHCCSTGVVSGDSCVGGLVGSNGWLLDRCYSTAAVNGTGWGWGVGGLVGRNAVSVAGLACPGAVTECYSTGAVSGKDSVGGLVGNNEYGRIATSYSTGHVSGSENVGGLVGSKYEGWGDVTDCFWDAQTSNQSSSAGGTGKTTAEMQDPKTFMAAGWDFVGQPDGPHDIWAEPEGGGYPILWWQQSPLPELPPFSGATGEANDPYLVSTAEQLNSIGHNPRLMTCHFKLVKNLDLAGFHFYPIGDGDHPYEGVFDGNGYTVSHLTINGESHLGLFGQLASGATVTDLCVLEVNITGSGSYVGALVGKSGNWINGGGIVTSCHSSGSISGRDYVGGLVGENYGSITTSYSTGSVRGAGQYGYVGGLVGDNSGDIVSSYSSGVVSGTESVGGLVGSNCGTIVTSYSSGVVSGTESVGGLVGSNFGGSVSASYSTGAVSGDGFVGGLVGHNRYGSVSSSFWDIQTSGAWWSHGGTGETTAEMQTASTFLDTGWDFLGETANGTEDIWWVNEGKDYPHLWWEEGDDASQF